MALIAENLEWNGTPRRSAWCPPDETICLQPLFSTTKYQNHAKFCFHYVTSAFDLPFMGSHLTLESSISVGILFLSISPFQRSNISLSLKFSSMISMFSGNFLSVQVEVCDSVDLNLPSITKKCGGHSVARPRRRPAGARETGQWSTFTTQRAIPSSIDKNRHC